MKEHLLITNKMIKQKLVSIVAISTLVVGFITLMSFRNDCSNLENGSYDVIFTTKGYSNFKLTINNDHFTKTSENGQLTYGTVEWTSDCIFILNETTSQSQTNTLAKKIEDGLGKECIQLRRKKGKSIKFKTSRTANLNIVLNEGKLMKVE